MASVYIICNEEISPSQYTEANERASRLVHTKFSLSDLNTEIPYRQLIYWFNEKLLISDPEAFKLKHINLLDFCWIHFVNSLRTFGMSLKSVMELKEILLSPISEEVMNQVIAEMGHVIKDLTPDQQNEILEILKKKTSERQRDGAYASGFFVAITYSLVLKRPMSVYISADNDIVILDELERESLMKVKPAIEILKGNFIRVSLSDIIWKFTGASILEIKKHHLELLNDTERQILDAIRDKGAREITIKYNGASEPEMIEITKVTKVELSARLLELLKRNQYQEITIKTQSGKITHYENTTKIKLTQGTSDGRPFIGL